MQTIKRFLIHPVTFCILFCSIIISGESNGSFYILILMLGLPYGALHALFGITGIVLLVISFYSKRTTIVAMLRLSSSICFISSLVRFFTQPGAGYNYPTFHQFVPLSVLGVFSISLLLFIISQLRLIKLRKNHSVMPA